ncbi:MAG TPA: PHP domain-containing protein, partial [Myxococcaceae bacterium]|nr:PHP domain-containing protein [Myxococcaceae bacterium]
MIDLHSHTTASDGEHAPAALLALARAAGVTVLGVTDHDTVAGLQRAETAAGAEGVRFVPGIEVSATAGGREVHVLGHFVDPGSAALRRFEDLLADKRRSRMEEMLRKLAPLGVDLTPCEVEQFSGGKTLGRPHVARAIM